MTCFDGKNMKMFHDFLMKSKWNVENSNDRLYLIWENITWMIDEYWENAKDYSNRDWKLILHWLINANKMKHNSISFNIYMKQKMRKYYIEYWQKFMIFILHEMNNLSQEYEIEYIKNQLNTLREIKKKLKKKDISNDELDRENINDVSIHYFSPGSNLLPRFCVEENQSSLQRGSHFLA